ncbi:copper chaperone PCu(A)C [Limoniibacter endophyticus]|uniref:Copper chaperone PCu(A)C n=1 Tax=Limoniibacter endophyticus TaxID=1565040 RepID=A0A8J3DDK1_9HYPH|nr:copper chaperone PCu(A)C [Limoniibacter endophyticus]GHC60296.1 hypothetical protein GCM10010136_00230 [Limoniibacter endophyticus]
MRKFAGTAALLLSLVASAAAAHEYKVGNLEIGHPWSRATLPGAVVGGGYLTITNNGTEDDRLVGGTTPVAKKVEIHEMKMDGGVMQMRQLDGGVAIPAGQTVKLDTGGYHLMLQELNAPLEKDTRVPLTLVFEKAGSVQVELAVGPAGGRAPAQDHSSHGEHSHGAHHSHEDGHKHD